ncbi:MAG TPA: hypothetical protein VF174_07110 [Micromonosporaceae bacterium]
MVRALSRRLARLALLIGLVGAATLPATGAHAEAAPTAVTISGDGLAEPLTVQAESDPALFAAILDQVSWLRFGTGHPAPPEELDLGPRYTVVLLVGEAATQTYDLYPLASGGPRAFRPGGQAGQGKTGPAWFFGRLNMSETLRAAGAPLPVRNDMLNSGFRGGERVIPDSPLGAEEQLDDLLTDLRHLVLLDAAVVVTITVGLAGFALLIRRRTR